MKYILFIIGVVAFISLVPNAYFCSCKEELEDDEL